MARLAQLPKWVVSNEESVEREAQPYRAMTPEQRLALGAANSRAAMTVALANAGRDTVFGHRDPLP